MILKQRKQFINQKQFDDVWFLHNLKQNPNKIPNRIPINNDTIINIIKNDLTSFWISIFNLYHKNQNIYKKFIKHTTTKHKQSKG